MIPRTNIGAHGWPLVPSKTFPGEQTLACPKCGSTNVTITIAYGPGSRLGDPGATDIIRCESCKHADYTRKYTPSAVTKWIVYFGATQNVYYTEYHAEQFARVLRLNGTPVRVEVTK